MQSLNGSRAMRAACLLSLSFTAQLSIAANSKLGHKEFKEDFAFACQEIASTYAYFDTKQTSWGDIKKLYDADLKRVTNRGEFVALLENVIDELYDPHAQLNTNTPSSWRLVPSGADLWAEWRDDQAVITQIRGESDAERAGIKAGSIVLAINDVDIRRAVDARMGRSYPHSVGAARDWALRSVLAGRHAKPRSIKLKEGSLEKTVNLPAADQFHASRSPITHSKLANNVGYIRFNDSLGRDDTVAAFDRALEDLRSSSALILDLRDTGSGGNTTVARGVLGRFVKGEAPYQKHELPSEERDTGVHRSWLELVSPRGPFQYDKKIVVLVGRWTGSMGEGMAIGLDAVANAVTVGTPMAQLVGATYTITLPNTGIGINVPAERVYHVNGMAREKYQPKVLVNVTQGSDPFIDAAMNAIANSNSGNH